MLFKIHPYLKKALKRKISKKDKKSQAPSNTGQQKLEIADKEKQITLLEFCSI